MSNSEISRFVGSDSSTDIGAMTMVLYGMPRPVEQVDAIAVMPGLGEYWRVAEAAKVWNQGAGSRFLIAGANPREKTYIEQSMDNLSRPPIGLTRHEEVYVQSEAMHTKHQAEWLNDKIDELDVESMALFVSPFHLLRAYATVLKTREKTDAPRIPIIPMPVAVSPDMIIPETEQGAAPNPSNAWGMVAGETKRIEQYQQKGDVATRAELQDYLSWLYRQPILGA